MAVSLTYSGKSYPDDLSEDGVIYHHPDTNRPKGRDLSEIEAIKIQRTSSVSNFMLSSVTRPNVLSVG